MKAQFATVFRADLAGRPLQLYCSLQEFLGKPIQELSITLSVVNGWVDAKQLMDTLRTIADRIEKELT